VVDEFDHIAVFAADTNGDAVPVRSIFGANTQLVSPRRLALDIDGRLYVTNDNNSITLYAADATADASPIRRIFGAGTGLSLPSGIAISGPRTGPVSP